MPFGSFEKDSWGWQLRQLQQRLGEWWELQSIKFADSMSELPLPLAIDSHLIKAIARVVFWVLLALLLSWAAFKIWQLLRPYIKKFKKQLSQQVEQKLEQPPEELSADRWLARSQRFQQQGDYSEACRCLYMAMLQRLNDSGIAPHQVSRTDGEYLQLIHPLTQAQPYQILLTTHQQLCFSNAEASRSLFEQCEQAYYQLKA